MAQCKPWLLCCCLLAALLCAVALVCLCVSLLADAPCAGRFRHAAVAADSERCSDIGRTMLQKGGSAVDGAIAALLCTAVVNPQSMGIGGGSIITIRDKTGKVKVYNFRETVPKSFKQNLLADCPTTFRMSTGTQWIGVPGELRGYEAIHKQYGKLPWAELFEPTIALAKDGFKIPTYLAKMLANPLAKHRVESTSLCKRFCNENKTVLGSGDTLKYPQLAESLKVIAEQGADAFYTGKIGQDLIEDIKAEGGTLSMEDLKTFSVRVDHAWVVPLGDMKMHFAPPPAGGALLAFILKLMQEFLSGPTPLSPDQMTQIYHHFIEVVKFANGQKKNIRDPHFHDITGVKRLIDPSFIANIKKKIFSNRTHDNSYYDNVKPSSDHLGTTHVSVLDDDGLAVSATSTINQLFGGAIYSSRTGIILNNELSDFCGRADSVRAGEMPPSSMTPVILESKSGHLIVIGGSGGSMITSAVALSVMNRLWLGMSLKDAIAKPIMFIDSANNVNFQPGFSQSVKTALEALGHKAGNWMFFLNMVNAVEKENGCIVAVTDQRKMGKAAGY